MSDFYGRGTQSLGLAFATILPAVLLAWEPVRAADYDWGEFDVTVHGLISFGSSIRTGTRDPQFTVNRVNGQTGGNDGDLNFNKGDAVSTVLKGVGAIDIHRGDFGIFTTAKTWDDLTLAYVGVPWGNSINGYVKNATLGEAGLNSLAKFSGVSIQQAYAYSTFNLFGMPLLVRAGDQTIPWGERGLIPGGLANSVSAFDNVEYHRPGLLLESVEAPSPGAFRPNFLPNETSIPSPGLFSRLQLTPSFGLEGFWQAAFQKNDIDPCGTFYAGNNYLAQGCNIAALGSGAVNSPLLIFRGPLFDAGQHASGRRLW